MSIAAKCRLRRWQIFSQVRCAACWRQVAHGVQRGDANAVCMRAADEIREDITSVPGIGPAAAKALASDEGGEPGVKTTYQLIGKFLVLREPGMTSQEHCDAFWYWLQVRHAYSLSD